jgi:hypothetical protein
VAFETADHLHGDGLQAWVGENDYYRAVGSKALSQNVWSPPTSGSTRGAWSTPEDLKKINLLGRALVGGWSITALAYDAEWNATDQIPRRAVEDGSLGYLDAVDKTDGGKTSRYILSARRRDLLRGLDSVVYVQRYKLDLYSNFTYFLDDPVNGDQFEQADQRWIYGGSLTKRWTLGDGWSARTGASARVDDIGKVGLYRTTARVRRETVRQDALTEWSTALWGEASKRFGKLDAAFGVRADAMGADVKAGDPRNTGDGQRPAGQPQTGPGLAGVEDLRALCRRRARLPLQRRAWSGDHGRSGHRRSGRARAATLALRRRRAGPALEA